MIAVLWIISGGNWRKFTAVDVDEKVPVVIDLQSCSRSFGGSPGDLEANGVISVRTASAFRVELQLQTITGAASVNDLDGGSVAGKAGPTEFDCTL